MGHGDGRPGTPGLDNRASEETRAGFSGAIVLVAIISFVMSVIALAIPYWGVFRPQSASRSDYATYGAGSYENSGFFGPWLKCQYGSNRFSQICGKSVRYQVEVYLRIGGVCAIVQVASTALLSIFSGLHCAMIINNKNIIIKYSTNIFLSFLSAVVAAIATLAACLITIPQFMLRKGEYLTQPGASYYIEVCLIFINILLTVVTYLSYAKARKTTFPKQRNPYEITAEHYGDDHVGGMSNQGRGITVTSNSGLPFNPSQVPSHHAPAHVSQLPQFPAPHGSHVSQSHFNNGGHVNVAMMGQVAQPQAPLQAHHHPYQQPVATVAPQMRPVPARDERVDLNPGGRVKTELKSGGMMGSMESLNSGTGSVLSFGSTVSSNASINNPLRSSLKKTKNKDNVSVASAASSKKSVRLALGEEQTAV